MSTGDSSTIESLKALEFSASIPCDDKRHPVDKERHDDGNAKWYLMDKCPSCGHKGYEECFAVCEKMAQHFMNDSREGMCVCGYTTLVSNFHVWRRIDEPFD